MAITTVHMFVPAEGDGGINDGAGICVGPRDEKKDKAMIIVTQLGDSI